MLPFATTREAKQFLIDAIIEQAERDQVSLSETEKRMLYFSESDWCPFDAVELNNAFELECDGGEYETKIAGIIRNFKRWAKQSSPSHLASWKVAARQISKEDHYLLVLIGVEEGSVRPDDQKSTTIILAFFLRVTIVSLLISGVIIAVMMVIRVLKD